MRVLRLTQDSFRISVDPARTISQMMEACHFGRVGRTSVGTRLDCPISASRLLDVSIAVIAGRRQLSTDDILVALRELNKRPLHFEELLALAATLQDIQLRLSAIALASQWQAPDGSRYVASCRLQSKRVLSFLPLEPEPAWVRSLDCFPCSPANT